MLTTKKPCSYGFGTLIVLLTIAAAQHPNNNATRCNSPHPPSAPHNLTNPPGTPALPSIHPWFVQKDISATNISDVGIGRPSKYRAFPVESLGTRATVALNRASRARPQHINVVRMTVSSSVRRPTANASKAGATPKDICHIESMTETE
jgi:hypothetical protein